MSALHTIALVGGVLVAQATYAAEAPNRSMRPMARPLAEAVETAVVLAAIAPVAPVAPDIAFAAPEVYYSARIRPTPRPDFVQTTRSLVAVSYFSQSTLRPVARPKDLATLHQAMSKKNADVPKGNYGAICGSKDILGQRIDPIPGKIKGCGIADPVRVYYVQGVKLSVPARMDCTTAKALNTWVAKSATPSFKKLGGLSELRVAAGYTCRTRNNQRGGKISEHGKGRAIDISAFKMKNGDTITVLKGWNQRKSSKVLRKVHKEACGPFGTVLGPKSDRHHKDHFHFDTARYRNGAYCR
ncbi:MAG: extensin family protein [Pseudoruegeria sp.]